MTVAKSLSSNITSLNKGTFIAAAATVAGVVALLSISHTAFGASYGYGYGYNNGGGQKGATNVYRAFSTKTGDHLLTTNAAEKAAAVSTGGYADEGVGFQGYTSPTTGVSPVYRAFNTSSGDHFLTTNFAEYVAAEKIGYQLEGVGFYNFAKAGDAPTDVLSTDVSRSWNSLKKTHFYTASSAEQTASGFGLEGGAFAAPTP